MQEGEVNETVPRLDDHAGDGHDISADAWRRMTTGGTDIDDRRRTTEGRKTMAIATMTPTRRIEVMMQKSDHNESARHEPGSDERRRSATTPHATTTSANATTSINHQQQGRDVGDTTPQHYRPRTHELTATATPHHESLHQTAEAIGDRLSTDPPLTTATTGTNPQSGPVPQSHGAARRTRSA